MVAHAKQDRFDRTYLRMAEELATLSHAERAKVGALIVKGTHIISEGYNGTPSGPWFRNECEVLDSVGEMHTRPEVIHAESNAITKLARSTNSSEGATLYVTLAPCFDCAKLIIQAGIKRVVYKHKYVKNGLKLLGTAGISIIRLHDKHDKTIKEAS